MYAFFVTAYWLLFCVFFHFLGFEREHESGEALRTEKTQRRGSI